jgi:hypothetical protein
MNKIKIILLSFVALAPLSAYAQQINQISNANDLAKRLLSIGNTAVYLLVALAVIFIVYYIVIYFIRGDSPEDKKKAGLNILWGIVGLFIIVSLWGLVNILVGTFGTSNTMPKFPNADFLNGANTQPSGFQEPSAANNFNNVTGGNENTQNYNH